MTVLTVGVLAETTPGGRRVAFDPVAVAVFTKAGRLVVVEHGAGNAATFPDAAFRAAGGDVTTVEDVLAHSDVIGVVGPPGQALIGLWIP